MLFNKSTYILGSFVLMVSSHVLADVITIENVDQYKKLHQGSSPLITMVTASWCGPCKSTKPHYIDLSDDYPEVVFCMVDKDDTSLSEIHKHIKSVPTFIYSHKGAQIDQITGGMPRGQLKETIDTFLAKALGRSMPVPEKKVFPSQNHCISFGKEYGKKLVDICSDKTFSLDDLDAILIDHNMTGIYEVLNAPHSSQDDRKKAFSCYKSYSRGLKEVLDTYKSQGKQPQDATITIQKNSCKVALKASDYAAYLTYQTNLTETFQKKFRPISMQLLAEISESLVS